MLKNFKMFLRCTADQKWVLTEAVLLLFAAKILLAFLPVKTVLKVSLASEGEVAVPDMNLLKDIKWALRNADRLAFWKNRCLVQSIAGRWMLQRRGIGSRIYFGVRHDSNRKITAHAWLKVGEIEVVEEGSACEELINFR